MNNKSTMNKPVTVKTCSGNKLHMTYKNLCHKLGFTWEIQFVRITTAQTIDFWAAKPHEAQTLLNACEIEGLMPSKALKNICK